MSKVARLRRRGTMAAADDVRSSAGIWVDDPQLRIEVERAAAAAGVPVGSPSAQRSPSAQQEGPGDGTIGPAPSEGDWARCPMIVLDPGAAEACVAARLPRRSAVLLVCAPESAGAGVWQRAVRLGADDVFLLPDDADSLLAAFHRHSGGRNRGGGGVITVVSGHGGAGASVLASALALTADPASLLVDLDPTGPGLDLILGVERDEGLRWPDLRVHDGSIDPEALYRALPRRGSVSVLAAGTTRADLTRSGRVPEAGASGLESGAVRSVLRTAGDGGRTVICDVSHQRAEAAVAAIEAGDLTVVVVRADVPSCAAAVKGASWAARHTSDLALVVRGPSPGGLRGGDIEEALGLPLLASMRPEPGLAKTLERGGLDFTRRSPLAGAARAIHRVHARRPETVAA